MPNSSEILETLFDSKTTRPQMATHTQALIVSSKSQLLVSPDHQEQ
jgi:hypothetical protein